VLRAYGDAGDDRPFLIWNAAGLLELAVREGRAADVLALRRGDAVAVRVLRATGAPPGP
jgi:S-adenosylmethionine hydrolase